MGVKILHTADWHLGKRLERFSRLEEQIVVMEEIIQVANNQNADIIIIAGDVFDNINPSVEAIELFYKTLKKLSRDGERPVIAIAGNHDSPNLIDAPNPLARECGIILIGHPQARVLAIELDSFKIIQTAEGFLELKLKHIDFPIRIIHSAYANEQRLKQYFGEEKEKSLNDTLAKHWQDLATQYCDKQGVNILTTHLYMNQLGTTLLDEPDGEKPLKIGNADMVYSDIIPSQIQYTALGHLHAYNNIGSMDKPVVYSSSPLCYSFSEAGQQKYVVMVEASPKENIKLEKIKLQTGKKLIKITFSDIEECIDWLTENPNTLVELTIESDSFLKAEDRKRIYQSHNGIIYLIPKTKKLDQHANTSTKIDLSKDLESLFVDYFKTKNNNQEPNEELLKLLQEIKNA